MPADVGGDRVTGAFEFLRDARGRSFFVKGKFRVGVKMFVEFEEAGILLLHPRANGVTDRSVLSDGG
jgi:hypothetical protein